MRLSRDRMIRSLEGFASRLPSESRSWVLAMVVETPKTGSWWEFLFWLFGVATVTFRLTVRNAFVSSERPLAISVTAVYFACFSSYLFFHAVIQIVTPGIHESWRDAWFPVVACLWLTLLPTVVAYGLWTCDNLARKLAIGLAALDLGSAASFTHAYGITGFRAAKMAADIAIIFAMLTPAVLNACRWPELASRSLGLSNR